VTVTVAAVRSFRRLSTTVSVIGFNFQRATL